MASKEVDEIACIGGCGKVFTRKNNMYRHFKHKCPNRIGLQNESTALRPRCNEIVTDGEISSHDNTVWMCNTCGIPFLCEGELNRHKQVRILYIYI